MIVRRKPLRYRRDYTFARRRVHGLDFGRIQHEIKLFEEMPFILKEEMEKQESAVLQMRQSVKSLEVH